MGLGLPGRDTRGSVDKLIIFSIDKRKFICYNLITKNERN